MLENERVVIPCCQENNIAVPDVIEKKAAEVKEEIKIPKKYREDIDTLRKCMERILKPDSVLI